LNYFFEDSSSRVHALIRKFIKNREKVLSYIVDFIDEELLSDDLRQCKNALFIYLETI
jgi:hypothetical protein